MPFPKLATFWSLGVQDSRSALAGMLCLTLVEHVSSLEQRLTGQRPVPARARARLQVTDS